LYGRTRLGEYRPYEKDAPPTGGGGEAPQDTVPSGKPTASAIGVQLFRTRGYVHYELMNHLGNVLATITDSKRILLPSFGGAGGGSFYVADIVSLQDYYAFGMAMPERGYGGGGAYRYGFNGKENDPETNWQDYGFRLYDRRACRFASVDPITAQYPELTPYQFASNTPISAIDLDGLEEYNVVVTPSNKTSGVQTTVFSLDRISRQQGKVNPPYIYTMNCNGNKLPINGDNAPQNLTTLAPNIVNSSYLALRLLNHYRYAQGGNYILNKDEMKEVKAVPVGLLGLEIDNTSPLSLYERREVYETKLMNTLKNMKVGTTVKYHITVQSVVETTGTLGGMAVSLDGELTKTSKKNEWAFDGTMSYHDTWDFDSKQDNKGSLRSPTGEFRTSYGRNFLSGTSFEVSSETIKVSQTSADNTVSAK
jgi:RHS repeat-associated protein